MTPISIGIARRRKPSAFGYLIREELPIAEELRGVAISTYGKVIKRGWDWLGVIPSAPERVRGIVEAPALAACLTLNKVDFFRSGPRGATYLAYRKAAGHSAGQKGWTQMDADFADERRWKERFRSFEEARLRPLAVSASGALWALRHLRSSASAVAI